MRKFFAIFIACFILQVGNPVPSFAKEKEKEKVHKSRQQRKAEKRQKKLWAFVRSRSNDYRFKDKHLGENMFKRQTPKEQKKRSKHHLKP